MNYFNNPFQTMANPMAGGVQQPVQPMIQPGINPMIPGQIPAQPGMMYPQNPAPVNPMMQPQMPGMIPGQMQMPQAQPQAAVPGFGGMVIPSNMEAIKNTLVIHLSAVSEDIKLVVANLIDYHIGRKQDISGEIARVDKKGFNLHVDYIAGTDTNPSFVITSNNGVAAVNPANGMTNMGNFGVATLNGMVVNRNTAAGGELTTLETSFNALMDKFDKIVTCVRQAGITTGSFEFNFANVSVVNGIVMLSPSTLILNNYKRDYAKQSFK